MWDIVWVDNGHLKGFEGFEEFEGFPDTERSRSAGFKGFGRYPDTERFRSAGFESFLVECAKFRLCH